MTVPINSLYAKSTLITYRNTDDRYELSSEASATGFFYRNGDSDYLVTNEHVLVDGEGDQIDVIDILLNNSRDISDYERKSIDLLDSEDPKWIGHSEADIAIIPLDINLDDYANLFYTKSDILPRDAVYGGSRIVSGGESSAVVGYPLGFTGGNKLPVIRNAMISTPYGVPFNDRPCFLIDARMHDGMSGSPVLSKVKHYSVSFNEGALDPEKETEVTSSVTPANQRFLLGIHSETVYPRSLRGHDSDLPDNDGMSPELIEIKNKVAELEERLDSQIDLHRVWYADLIHKVLND